MIVEFFRSIRGNLFAAPADDEDIHAWRARVLSAILLVTVILGCVAAIPSILISISAELWSVVAVDSIALAWIFVIWRVRSLSYPVRAWHFCAIFYLLGTFLLFKVGHASQIYLMAFPVMAALLLGLRPALIALAANAITLFAGGYLLDADIHIAGLEQSSFLNWSVITVNFVIVNSLITFCTVMLLHGLERSFAQKRDSERRYRTLTEWSPEPTMVHRDGKIIYVNQAAIGMLGAASAQDLLGKPALDFVHPDYRPAVLDRIQDALKRGVSNPMMEEKIIKLDGSVIDAEVQGIPIVYDDAPAIQVAMRDITERKRAQTERSALERQLSQAQKMEAIGKLTGGVAHDFNNLLAVILGRLEMTKVELADRPLLQAWIEACIKAAQRGATLTRSMLAYSRQQPLQMVPINVAAALGETVTLLQRTLGDAIEVTDVCAPDLWVCEADPAQLQTALLNLALNARDAMPEGGALTIDARNVRFQMGGAAPHPEMAPGTYVAISVADTGTGMTPEVVESAFEPFFTTKEFGKGSGLGLSMVYGYVKQVGGHIKIDSEVGSGTTVRLYFPRVAASAEATDQEGSSASAQSLRGREEILVVEDNEEMRELAVSLLEHLGYTVYSAEHGPEALPLLERHRTIALLLTDIALPAGMNGLRVAERALEILPHLKVVYMSGHSEETIMRQDRHGRDIRLLQKPFEAEELAAEIRAALTEP